MQNNIDTQNTWRIALGALLLVPALALAGGGDILLQNDFDSEPIGTIATVTVGDGAHPLAPFAALAAVVNDGGNNYLQVTDNHTLVIGSLKFNFLNDEEVASGILCVSYTVTFDTLDQYTFSFYNRGLPDIAQLFHQVRFNSGGQMNFFDADDISPSMLTLLYAIDTPYLFEFEYDLDAGTYDMSINGTKYFDDEAHGVVGGSMGTLWFQPANDFNSGDTFRLDDILVQKGAVQTDVAGPAEGAGTEAIRPAAMMAMPWPNPVHTAANLSFTLPQAANATVNVYDLAGRKVTTLLDETRGAGAHALQWNRRDASGRRVNAGVYFVRLETPGTQISRKVIVVE